MFTATILIDGNCFWHIWCNNILLLSINYFTSLFSIYFLNFYYFVYRLYDVIFKYWDILQKINNNPITGLIGYYYQGKYSLNRINTSRMKTFKPRERFSDMVIYILIVLHVIPSHVPYN